MKKESKKALIAGLIIGGCIIALIAVAAVALAVIFPLFKAKDVVKTDVVMAERGRQYVSDFPIANGQTLHRVNGKWSVQKKKTDGVELLYIWNPGIKEDELEYLNFTVFNDADDARSAYEGMYEIYSEYSGGHGSWGWDEGTNWFTSEEPGVCDASIVQIIYLEDNIIIAADIEVSGEWGMPVETEETTETTAIQNVFDRSTLKEYVIENAADIRSVVLNVILDENFNPDLSDVEIRDGYVAVLRDGSGEIMRETYVYEMVRGYRYINTTSTTESWGSTHWNTVVDNEGYLNTKEEIVEVAGDHGSCGFVTYPGDSRTYSVDDFLSDN